MEVKQLKIEEENRKINSCVLTGHREIFEGFDAEKLEKTLKEIIKKGVFIFYNGGATGFDLISAEILLKLKEENEKIKLILCIPCPNQEKYYSEENKKKYDEIVNKADKKILINDHYFRGCMNKRDTYMADRGDMMIAYLKKQNGGTAYTVKYYQKKNPQKEIVFL